MLMAVLFGLLLWCLAGFHEGVWTQYAPQDVARWQVQAAAAARAAAVTRSPAVPGRQHVNEARRPRSRTAGYAQVNTGRKKLRS